MASARFLEDALSTDVDESAVSAIVGSLEDQFVTSSSTPSTQNTFININPNQLNIASSGSSIIGIQKYNADRSNPNEVKLVNSVNFSSADPHGGVVFNNVQGSMHNFITAVNNVSQANLNCTPNSNEQIKVIYSQTSQAVPTITSNRISFPAQSLANGSIALAAPQNIISSVVSGNLAGNKSINMQPPIVIKQGSTAGQVGLQPGMVTVPMSVSSSMPASMNNVMTLNKPVGQNVITSNQNMGGNNPTIIPNVQILNMRPGAPGVSTQKSVATVSPRVVIGAPQVVGARAATPGITLQTLQGLQPGQQGHLLLKTENGQYQLLRVGPAPAASTLTAPPAQTIRLSTVPAHPGVATVSTSVAAPQMQAQISSTPVAPAGLGATAGTPPPQSPTVSSQKPSDNTKEKCRNFLANLLDLSSKEPKSVERNVRQLIQELIDAQVEPEEFCDRLERLLNASPQPCLIGFLKKSLPLLRQSLVTKELVIEGINPPAPHIAFSTAPAPAPAPAQTIINTSNIQLVNVLGGAQAMSEGQCGQLTTLLPPVISMGSIPMQVPTAKTVNIISAAPLQAMQAMQPMQIQQHKPQQKNTIAVLQNIPIQPQKLNINKVSSAKVINKGLSRVGTNSAALNTVLTPGKSTMKDKEKKASQQFAPQHFGDDKMAGDDDINDVAAMGGVNLAEESQRILGSTELIGTQIRSCKDEYLVPMHLMQARVKAAAARHGLEETSPEVAGLISHAVHERLKNIVEKLAVIAQHRIDMLIKTDPRYEVTQDVKGQLKFLEELDRMEKKRREDSEREILLRAAKSRSKNEDPEQAKLKAKAKEMQRAELEELRQREANLTALQAIGPRKKPKLEGPGGAGDSAASGGTQSGNIGGRGQMALRTRLKRINHRDVVYLLEQERETAHSPMLYRCYLK